MLYKYSAYDKSGQKIKGTVEATSIDEAKKKLSHLILIEIEEQRSFFLPTFSKKFQKSEFSRYFRTLGLYLKANIPILQALQLTKEQLDSIILIKFTDLLQQNIKEGKTLYQALQTQQIFSFPLYILNSIKVGEESGKLDLILLELSRYLKEEERISSKSKQAFIYPSFIITVSFFMVGFILNFVVPKIVHVFQSLDQQLPPITQFVIRSGHFVQQYGVMIIITLTLLLSIFVLVYKKSKTIRFFIDKLLLKIPLLKKVIISKELGRLSYLIFTLTSSGLTYVQSVKLATQTISNSYIKSYFTKALDEVNAGKKLSTALQLKGFDLDKSFLQALALAEETSEVDKILQNLSEIYFEENENFINTFLSVLEPFLILLVGGIIGFIVTALLLPIFKMNILH